MKLQCPNCKATFQVDENEYASILSQVRTMEFQNEIDQRLQEIKKQYLAEQKAHDLEASSIFDKKLALHQSEMLDLKSEIARLQGLVDNAETHRQVALAEAEAIKFKELGELKATKEKEINELRARLSLSDSEHALDLEKQKNEHNKLLHSKEQHLSELKSRLDAEELAHQAKILQINESNDLMLRQKDDMIERLKDMKSRLSTKMIGETLEQHCQNMFNRSRSMGQYPDAYFEKDNDATQGSKGDFIFRDFIDGEEYISIMFEMKNEDERTATKHRNEDFFSKLDRDRHAKNCEYAVLVTLLEADNDFYNEGIVDVSYRYEKMLVVRPQFFMAVVHLLSKTARRGAERMRDLQMQLAVAKEQSIDVTNFEERCSKFVGDFKKLVGDHLKKQDSALEGIDKAIRSAEQQVAKLREIRRMFEDSGSKLRKAEELAENGLTVKKLARGNPTMKRLFAEAAEKARVKRDTNE